MGPVALDGHARLGVVVIPSPRLIAFYLLMLLLHAGHVLEEVYGRFWVMEQVCGVGPFLLVNWFLLAVPMVFFYFVLMGRRWAYLAGRGYAAVMVLDGLVYNIALLAAGRYFSGWAGAVTGWGLIGAGALLYRRLRQDQRLGET